MDSIPDAIFGFATLLFFPLLGVLGLLKERSSRVLWVLVIAWTLLGGLALAAGHHPGSTRREFVRAWLIGIALGAGFLAVDWIRRRRRVARALKLCLAALAILVFARALVDYLGRYA